MVTKLPICTSLFLMVISSLQAQDSPADFVKKHTAPKVSAPECPAPTAQLNFDKVLQEYESFKATIGAKFFGAGLEGSQEKVFAPIVPKNEEIVKSSAALKTALQKLDRYLLLPSQKKQIEKMNREISIFWARCAFHHYLIDSNIKLERGKPEYENNLRLMRENIGWQSLDALKELRAATKYLSGPHSSRAFVIADTSEAAAPGKPANAIGNAVFYRSGQAMAAKLDAEFIGLSSVDNLTSRLIFKTAEQDIDRVLVIGHANSGMQFINNQAMIPEYFSWSDNDFAKDAHFRLLGCEAASEDAGLKYLQELGQAAMGKNGGTIKGYLYRGSIYKFGNIYFDLESGPKPTWHSLPNFFGAEVTREVKIKASKESK